MGNIISHCSSTPSESADGYHSDDLDHGSKNCHRQIRKKGIPWTEEEHRRFLLGLQNMGKGDWRGISKNYVGSRTSTQVASHAQKYFIRQSNSSRKKKRSSLFDMDPNPMASTKNGKPVVPLSSQVAEMKNAMPCLDLCLKPAFTPFPLQLWPPDAYSHEVKLVKEEPIHELMSLSQLTLGETGKLLNEPLNFSLSVAGNL